MNKSNLSSKSAAVRLVDALVKLGIDTFFGVPGGPISPLFEAIRINPKVKLIESRHENHAVFAAALYQRSSGKIPVVVVTAGPGITNAVTGVTSANLEKIPMLIICGDVPWASKGECLAQDSGPNGIDVESIYASITQAQVRAARPESVVSQAISALQDAVEHSCPSLFVLPLNHAVASCEEFDISSVSLYSKSIPIVNKNLNKISKNILKVLLNAERPLIVLGYGCKDNEDTIEEFLNATNIPFVTTPRAKGLFDETKINSLRNGGMAASIWAKKYTAEPIDVCLVLGTDIDDTSMGPTKYVRPNGLLYHVDIDSKVFGRNVQCTQGIVSDVGVFVKSLMKNKALRHNNIESIVANIKINNSPHDYANPEKDNSEPITPHKLLTELQHCSPKETRFITDIGEHMLFSLHYLTAKKNNFYIQLNLGSMGSGIAGAIGLSVANKTPPVICITGDGCMQMSGMEILVALKEKLPILFVVFNDGRYNMVHHGMKQIYGDASEYNTPPIDFTKWADSINLPNKLITKPNEISKELISNLTKNGPGLLDVRINSETRIRGGGRVESLQQMSMLSKAQETLV